MTAQDWRSLMSIASQVSEEEKRRLLLDGIYSVVQNWQGPLPDFLEIYRPEKIECLLSYAVTDQKGDEEARIRFIKFVVDTGYRDQPKVGTDGRYVLHRTTPIHLVLRAKINNWDAIGMNMVHFLFEIYNRFDLNYIDETGFTHFQAACSIFNGHQLVVKFLEHGQNPNFFIKGYSLLRSALHNDTKWAAELLRRGADPTWVDADGSTALHIICRNGCVDLLQLFFEIVDNHRKPVWVNARDSFGDTPLHLALESGNVRTSEILLKRGADVNLANKEGSTPLHTICRKTDNNGLIEAFFRVNDENHQTVQVNVRDIWDNTPLHLAILHGNKKATEILLTKGSDPNSANKEGSTPLHTICRRTDKNGLIDAFFRINDENHQTVQVNALDRKGNTPLHLALENSNKRMYEILLERGADVNLFNEEGSTPLHIICRKAEADFLVEKFFTINARLNKPVQINARDTWHNTPLHLAVLQGNKKATEILLTNGADPNLANAQGSTPLHTICRRIDNSDLIEAFFRVNNEKHQTVQVNVYDSFGNTPLHLAIIHRSTRKYVILLANGASPNLADWNGCTALHLVSNTLRPFSAMKQFFEIIDEMQQTVQIDARDNKGWTPLHMALHSGSKKKSQMLLKRGADPNVANQDGWTALHFLSQRTSDDFMCHFLNIIRDMQQPVEIDARDTRGRTPLFAALLDKNTKAAEKLLERGANPNLADEDGWTPLHIMCIKCNWFLEMFFRINAERQQPVEINAKTYEGTTPLNLLRNRMPMNYEEASRYLEQLGAELD